MANEQNLQPMPPWEKGQSGNPKGRVVGSRNKATIAKMYFECRVKGRDPYELVEEGHLTSEHIAVMKQVEKARKGDLNALTWLMDNIWGKTPEVIITDPNQVAQVTDLFVTPEQAQAAYERAARGG
jgi:hypothetical protein